MRSELRMEYMTWQEIEAAMKEGYTTVVLISGSIEQHGPHLPLGTDTMLGYALGEAVAKKLGNALVAPVIRPGLSEHHMAFKGSLTLSPAVFKATVSEIVDSLVRHGFESIVLASSHGGNESALVQLAPELAARYPAVKFLVNFDLTPLFAQLAKIGAEDGIDLAELGAHAGEFETSAMMAYDESLVRKDKLDVGFLGDLVSDEESIQKLIKNGLHSLTDNGILGDARKSNKQRGEKYLEIFGQSVIDGLHQI